MKTDLFILNDEHILEINKPELRNIKEFKTIITRDKGGTEVGDYDGRRKLFAYKELMFVYTYSNPGSIYRDLPEEIKIEKCKEEASLPSDWKVDKVIKAACSKYIDILDMSAMYHSYINSNKAVYSIGEDIKFFNTLKEKVRKSIEEKSKQILEETLEETIQPLEAEVDRLTEKLLTLGNRIMTMANKLPEAYDTIELLKKKLLKESQQGAEVYGGGKISKREK